MKTWFTSLNGAITLSAVAMLFFIAYAFLVSRYLLKQLTPGITAAGIETVVVMVIVGGWLWGLLAAAGGGRGGLFAVLVFNTLPVLFTLYDLLFYSPIPYGWPLLQIVVVGTFIVCVAAVAALAFQLK